MPLVQIHVIRGVRSSPALRKMADVIHRCILDKFNAPPGDRYQIITQHGPEELIMEDTGLQLSRTENIVVLQIYQQGRSAETKQQLYQALAKNLQSECGVAGSDLIISLVANSQEDWSFGLGRAQFLTGDL